MSFSAALTSCGTLSFYTQAIRGQAEISLSKEPIAKVLERRDLDPEVAAKLRLSQTLVAFAERELSLPGNGAYQDYTDLKREHVTHVVYAAPEFSLEPKTWWYPVVGSQDYRGYFREADAEKLALSLRKKGYETYLGGVNAYSTLGFFNDPILNTFIDYPEMDFAELLFHELTHQRYYKPRDTPFNEALAEVVAREGTRRWLRQKGDQDALAKYELRLKRRSQIRAEIIVTIASLETLYASNLGPVAMRSQKQNELAKLQTRIETLYRGWEQKPTNFLSTPLNNARLVAFTTYEELVPEFERLLARHNGDIDAFLTGVEEHGLTR